MKKFSKRKALPTSCALVDDNRLTSLMTRWQSHLGLSKWRIHLRLEPRLPSLVYGRCFWDGELRDAEIILNPKAHSKSDLIEETILHELLHLYFSELGDPPPACVEIAVDKLSKLLLPLMLKK